VRRGFLVAFALLASGAQAQLFPARPDNTFIADEAKLIAPKDRESITWVAKEVLALTEAPIVVVTIPSLTAVGAKDIGIERYARRMFDTWQIGSRHANHGMLIVVAKESHQYRLELGKDWQGTWSGQGRAALRNAMIPFFQHGQYSSGINAATTLLAALAFKASGVTPAQLSHYATAHPGPWSATRPFSRRQPSAGHVVPIPQP